MNIENEKRCKEILNLLYEIRKNGDGVQDVIKAAVKVLDFTGNIFGFDYAVFNNEFKQLHKTIQQNIMRVFLKLISGLDENKDDIDKRNEGVYKVVRAMKEAKITDISLPYV